jgi:uncharacterized protein YeaO (DUF488 family)
MAIRIVRLGTPRAPDEGIRLGTVRRPPRGVAKADYSRLNYFDVWLPDLAPSAALLAWVRQKPLTEKRWTASIGCFCADEGHCHRSVLRELLDQGGAVLA